MKKQVKSVPIYKGKLIFIDSENNEKLRKMCPAILEEEDLYAHAVKGSYKGFMGYFLVIDSSRYPISPGTIAHEAVHIAMYIFETVGATVENDNPEPFTYLVGYITDEFHKWASKNKIKIR